MLAYFDCFSGVSGDMTLGAMIDLGVPAQWLKEQLRSIPLPDFNLKTSRVKRNQIQACNVDVFITDNDVSRTYADIRKLIEDSSLSSRVIDQSIAVFRIIAKAESKIHRCPLEAVHFHEVGGTDAIVDIVGTALCLEFLNIKKCVCSKIPFGKGFVDTRHGRLPVPAPATAEILKEVPVFGTDIEGELVTPTGAAIVKTLSNDFRPLPELSIARIGYGAGKTNLDPHPNLLRIIIGREIEKKDVNSKFIKIETCIDDMNAELFGYVMERLFEAGAVDVYWVPTYMKKNRPGTMIQVLCSAGVKDVVVDRLLSETTTLGVRYFPVERVTLKRDLVTRTTSFGKIRVKKVYQRNGKDYFTPEYEICRQIAIEKEIPLKSVYEIISKELNGT